MRVRTENLFLCANLIFEQWEDHSVSLKQIESTPVSLPELYGKRLKEIFVQCGQILKSEDSCFNLLRYILAAKELLNTDTLCQLLNSLDPSMKLVDIKYLSRRQK